MLQRYRRRYRRPPDDIAVWRRRYTSAILPLLRATQGRWPPQVSPIAQERSQEALLCGYGRWLTEVCGLSQDTLSKNSRAARMFLQWRGNRAKPDSLALLNIAEIDAYFAWRMPGLRRATRSGVCQCMRSFLRYLLASKVIDADLSSLVSGPIMYDNAEIPRAFTEEQVAALLKCTRRDQSPKGLRDYAMFLMLTTYGLRAGEVVWLSLQDIDWKNDKVRIQRSKTQAESFLPLMRPVGEALIEYLRRGRPQSSSRKVFLRCRAPYRPFCSTSPLNDSIGSRLKEAGIEVNGRHGPHAFRFARALSLLRASVPLKPIADLLGHKTTSSTQVYLKLQTEDLRAVSLNLPKKESNANVAK